MALKDAEKVPVDPAALRELTVDELQDELGRLQEAQFRLRFRSATEDVTDNNPLQFRVIRRNVARMKTVLREKKST